MRTVSEGKGREGLFTLSLSPFWGGGGVLRVGGEDCMIGCDCDRDGVGVGMWGYGIYGLYIVRCSVDGVLNVDVSMDVSMDVNVDVNVNMNVNVNMYVNVDIYILILILIGP